MVVTVQRWSGSEARALRAAMRASVRAFAEKLGVSPRQVSNWEDRGSAIVPNLESQQILDTTLHRAGEDVQARFQAILQSGQARVFPQPASEQALVSAVTGDVNVIRHPIDGKQMALIETGSFLSSFENISVHLSAYYLDITPTTNAQYAAFIAATGHHSPPHWTDNAYHANFREHPVVNVTHADAAAYARWARKLLPSAEEWEKAARGTAGHVYPWGAQATPAKCNVRQTGVGSTTPVTRYHSGVSPFGIYDMCGNTWEWCRTETEPGRFVLKGSAFTSPLELGRGAAMNDASTSMFDDDTGFRCSSSREEVERLMAGVEG